MITSRLRHPDWSKTAVVYEINLRHFTPEGTIVAAEAHLPRLQELGVELLWLMPIHPIGEERRKGALGSPYSVRDHFAVHRDLGDIDDLRRFVRAAHARGMHVILDWVANHTAWDHPLVAQHPEWYRRDWKGDLRPTPWWDWTDIIELDFSHAGVRRYMADAMAYWVRDAGIDGYRCDVAGFVPLDFWNTVRRDLDAITPVFMVAEWEARDLHAEGFDATYAWTWYRALRDIASGRRRDLGGLFTYYSWNESAYPADAMRLTFVSNHDKNAWDGTEFEVFGDALAPAMVLSAVGEGLPLVYCGQEAGNTRRLPFFDGADPIAWRPHANGDLYRRLFSLRKAHGALWNAPWGARMIQVRASVPAAVLGFVRRNADGTVFVAINFSGAPQTVTFEDRLHHGRYAEYFSGDATTFCGGSRLELGPWDFRVFVA